MRPDELDRELTALLEETAVLRAPESLGRAFDERLARTQRRAGWLTLQRWIPFETRATFGTAPRTVAVLVALALVAALASGALAVGARLLTAPDLDVIVVAQDGSGTVRTVSEAIELAGDGDTIYVRPGHYVEAVVIEHDVTMVGEGDRSEIILEAPPNGPLVQIAPEWRFGPPKNPPGPEPYALRLIDADATLSGLTLSGERSEILVQGGATTLEKLAFDRVGRTWTEYAFGTSAIGVAGDASVHVLDGTFDGGAGIVVWEGAATIEGNVLRSGPRILAAGDVMTIRGNTIDGALTTGIFIPEAGPGAVTIESNSITSAGAEGILLDSGVGTVRANTVRGSTLAAIEIQIGADVTVAENELSHSQSGLVVEGSATHVIDNRIHDNVTGLRVGISGATAVSGNTITSNIVGLSYGGAPITLADNTICDNETDLFVGPFTQAPDITGNQPCPDHQLASGG